MLHKLHSQPDLFILGSATRTLAQVDLGLLRLCLRELAVEKRRNLARNVLSKHELALCADHAFQQLSQNLMPAAEPGSHRSGGTIESLRDLFIGKIVEIPQQDRNPELRGQRRHGRPYGV